LPTFEVALINRRNSMIERAVQRAKINKAAVDTLDCLLPGPTKDPVETKRWKSVVERVDSIITKNIATNVLAYPLIHDLAQLTHEMKAWRGFRQQALSRVMDEKLQRTRQQATSPRPRGGKHSESVSLPSLTSLSNTNKAAMTKKIARSEAKTKYTKGRNEGRSTKAHRQSHSGARTKKERGERTKKERGGGLAEFCLSRNIDLYDDSYAREETTEDKLKSKLRATLKGAVSRTTQLLSLERTPVKIPMKNGNGDAYGDDMNLSLSPKKKKHNFDEGIRLDTQLRVHNVQSSLVDLSTLAEYKGLREAAKLPDVSLQKMRKFMTRAI
jgi:hypothetical protein